MVSEYRGGDPGADPADEWDTSRGDRTVNRYDDQISIDRDGITIGSDRLPGVIAYGGIQVRKSSAIPGHWLVTVQLMTGREPVLGDGVTADEDGLVWSDKNPPVRGAT